ncbi:MAG TPA: polysaccharide deacetylase family protein [Anaerovoracaceae bacterium]|nr:polysaccharide deacetylase family protein [Anaerovoracaceae bacterium]
MKSNKVLIIVVFITVFAIFVYQVVTLGTIIYQNHSAMKEQIQSTASIEEGVVIRSGLPNSGKLVFSCNVDWGEEVIPDLLKVLKDNNVHITFFVSGRWAENNPDLLKDMYQAGHEIQSHGYGHKLCSQISVETAKEEILKTEKVILDILGVKTNVFAPPSGDYDETTVELCKSLGYKMALWSADTIDWREGSTAEVIIDRVLKKNLNGAVVLMHPKEETVKALPVLIEKIKAQGIDIVPLYRLSH